jgi:RNA polymerase sigma factor (sigma-70 family)
MKMVPESTRVHTTDPELLERVRDWRDSQAWARFVSHYNPRLRAVCRAYGLVEDSADDCCQQVWIKLASAMRRFHYDPGRRFRYWLQSFFHSRVKDVLRAAPRSEWPLIGDIAVDREPPEPDADEPCDPEISGMLRRAEAVQEAVQARVAPESWEVFRLVAIEGQPVGDAARSLGREYTTVYRAFKRVSRMIDDERRLGTSP